MVDPHGKDPEEIKNAREQIEQLFKQFNLAIQASLSSMSSIKIADIADQNPSHFLIKYCSSPLGLWNITIKKITLLKKQKFTFYSDLEQREEFLPVTKIRELRTFDVPDPSLCVRIEAEDSVFVYSIDMFYAIDTAGNAKLQDVRLDNIEGITEDTPQALVTQSAGYSSFAETIMELTASGIIIELLKKAVGL